MRYVFASPKGGPGKSCLAIHLAQYFSQRFKTLLIDGDKEPAAARWAARRRDAGVGPSPTTICLTGDAIYDEGIELVGDYERVVIDTNGGDGGSMRNGMLLASRLIMPMQSSASDADTLETLLGIYRQARNVNDALELKVAVNQTYPNEVGEDVREIAAEFGIPVFPQHLVRRKPIAQAVSTGRTIFERRPTVAKATHEMRTLLAQMENWS